MNDTWQEVVEGDQAWTVINADCLAVMEKMSNGCVDLVVTDPPYAISVAGMTFDRLPGKGSRNLDYFAGDSDWKTMLQDVVLPAVKETIRILKPTGSFYCWCSHRQLTHISDLLEAAEYSTRVIIWRKKCPPPPGSGWGSAVELCIYAYRHGRTWNGELGRLDNVIDADSYRHGQPGKVNHPTQKPPECFEQFVALSSNPGDIVFDPFLGSGTSGVVCRIANRRFIGCEIHPEYAALARSRIEPPKLDWF